MYQALPSTLFDVFLLLFQCVLDTLLKLVGLGAAFWKLSFLSPLYRNAPVTDVATVLGFPWICRAELRFSHLCSKPSLQPKRSIQWLSATSVDNEKYYRVGKNRPLKPDMHKFSSWLWFSISIALSSSVNHIKIMGTVLIECWGSDVHAGIW